ncbi:MAG: monovalent cation/H+ antiporter subunit D family protein [Candidatus Hydrothermarchaeales archaeon]
MPTTISATLLSFFMAISMAFTVQKAGPIHYYLGNWEPPWGIEVAVDYLGAFVALMVTGIGLLIVIFSVRYAEEMIDERNIYLYYALVLLLLAGLTGMVVTGDIFNLFVFLEIASLSSYALVPIAGKKGTEGQFESSFRYLYMGAMASSFVLLGIGLTYMTTGTLNMADLAVRIKEVAMPNYPRVLLAGLGFLVVGFSLKTALFPLHIWVPDAYTHAPAPVNALCSGITLEVGAYVLIRLFYSIFGMPVVNGTALDEILPLLAGIAIIFGSLFAIAQNDVFRMLAYSTISQMGYIVLGATLFSHNGLIGGIYHLINHSVMKGTMFLAVGAVVYKTGIRDIPEFGGLGKKMPLTMGAFSISALGMVGIPPLAGFMSKFFLVLGSLQSNMAFVFVILASSLLNAVYFMRVINHIYFGVPEDLVIKRDEAPLSMLIPTVIMGLGVIALGLFPGAPLSLIKPAVKLLGL